MEGRVMDTHTDLGEARYIHNGYLTFTAVPHFKYHTDAGHGWIEVSKSLAKALGFTKEISSYSYHDQDNYYLEEDGDAGVLINALKNRGQVYRMDDCFMEGDSFVRALASVKK